jgi:uncharacterized protein YjbI with pentapeptide repeats
VSNIGTPSQLQGADLTGANLAAVNFKNAEYDGRTKFPTGFDPDDENMIFAASDLAG